MHHKEEDSIKVEGLLKPIQAGSLIRKWTIRRSVIYTFLVRLGKIILSLRVSREEFLK